MQLVMTEDFEQRLDGGLKLFDDIFICEILRYGIYNDVRMIPDLQQFYRYELMRSHPSAGVKSTVTSRHGGKRELRIGERVHAIHR